MNNDPHYRGVGVFALCFLGAVSALAQPAAQPLVATPANGAGMQAPQAIVYAVGDTLKIAFYESLKTENAAKWPGNPDLPGPSYYLHPELSGEYTVQPDWNVSIPMIGSVAVAGQDQAQVQTKLDAAFRKLIGHTGFVSVVIADRQPLYVTGAVTKPGSYKYSIGMTPLVLVALAGGGVQNRQDQWAVVEAVQVAGKEAASRQRLEHLLAEAAVLNGELKGVPPGVPPALVGLCGDQQAESLVTEAKADRAPVEQARDERRKALQLAIDTAQRILQIEQGRLPDLAKGIDVRKDRVASLRLLASRGDVQRVTMDEALGELLDAQDRRAALLGSIEQDERQLASARIEAVSFDAETKGKLAQELAQQKAEIATLTPDLAVDAGIVSLMKPKSGDADPHFEIVRAGHILPASVTTQLLPGDLLRVEAGTQSPPAQSDDSRESYNQVSSRTD